MKAPPPLVCVLLLSALASAASLAPTSEQHEPWPTDADGRDRKLLQAAAPPLRIKLFTPSPECTAVDIAGNVTADIAAANAFATLAKRRTLAFVGATALTNPVAELAAGTFDMLLAYTFCTGSEVVFTAGQEAALADALTKGTLQKLMVWHAWTFALSAVRVPGIQASGCILSFVSAIDANPALYSGVGLPASGANILGDVASHGYCPSFSVDALPSSATHTRASDNANRVTSFSYCFGRGTVFFSQTPMDYYFEPVVKNGANLSPAMRNLHVNSLSVFSNDIACLTPPTCPPDAVTVARLPPNKQLFPVNVTGVPIQDPKTPGTVAITAVLFSDAVRGARPTYPLAVFDPSGEAIVQLRAERNGAGSGRLYRIQYTASNVAGFCTGSVLVCVPHDASERQARCPGASTIAAWMPTAAPGGG